MQPESRFATSFSEEMGIEEENATSPFPVQNQTVKTVTVKMVSKQRETKLDTVSTSVVIGMTALFVVFIFGLVTEFMPRLLDTILLSMFVGLCVSVIAFALIKDGD